MNNQNTKRRMTLTGLVAAAFVVGSLTAAPAAMAAPSADTVAMSSVSSQVAASAPVAQLGSTFGVDTAQAPTLRGPVKAAVYKYPWWRWIIVCISYTGYPISDPVCRRGPA